jgi:lysylphosphatidylglycerol synthetase-like protein (DUF2156 family)
MGSKKEKGWTEMNLLEELAASINEHERLARITFHWADTLLWICVFTSVASGVLVGLSTGVDWLKTHAWIIAIVAALPALSLSLERSFKWSARADWHFNYFIRMLAIFRRHRDEGLSHTDASQELTMLDLKINETHPGRSFPVSGAPTGRGKPR